MLPDLWKEGLIVPIHKKGDTKKRSNYHGITLLNTCYPVILLERIKPYTKEMVGEFKHKRSTIDQNKEIMEKCFDREQIKC